MGPIIEVIGYSIVGVSAIIVIVALWILYGRYVRDKISSEDLHLSQAELISKYGSSLAFFVVKERYRHRWYLWFRDRFIMIHSWLRKQLWRK